MSEDHSPSPPDANGPSGGFKDATVDTGLAPRRGQVAARVDLAVNRLTPEEARALVERAGSQAAAAREIGVPRTTFQSWLDPERRRAREREAYARNPEPKRAREREHYENLTGVEYNRLLLRRRRTKALRRMAAREQRRGNWLDVEEGQ